MRIIGITGTARSGKSTAADFISIQYDYKQLSFAQPVKEMVSALTGIPFDELEEWKNRKLPILDRTTREVMQSLGTEWGRNSLGQNIWVNYLISEIHDLEDAGYRGDIVIPDVRFNNEAEAIREAGGLILRIVRDAPIDDVTDFTHISELGIYPHLIDASIDNTGNLARMYQNIDSIVDLYDFILSLRGMT